MKKKLILGAAMAALGLTAFGEPSVEITEAWQENPGSGIVNYTYKISDLDGAYYDLRIKVGAKGATPREVVIEDVSDGTVTTSVNVKELLGKAYQNVTLYATLANYVQLWENGPCFAKCNVGAKRPNEAGYYFWWGDTVGYVRNGSSWVSADGKGTIISFSTGAPAGSTLLDEGALKSNGWIGDDGNLAPEHDAATAHLGAPWRMMTQAERDALVANCTTEWTGNWNNTGVSGRIVTGKGAYASCSVFFPAVGYGDGGSFSKYGTIGDYWSSTPYPDSINAMGFNLSSGGFGAFNSRRNYGFQVRPVRGAAR